MNCFEMKTVFFAVITIFQFFGMWPISNGEISDNNKKSTNYCLIFLIIWSLINIFSLSAYIVVICVYYELVLSKVRSIGIFSAIAKGGTVLMTHLIILLESVFTRNGQTNIWIKAKYVDRTFEKMGIATDVHNRNFYRRYSLKFFAFQIFAWISEIAVICYVENNVSWKLFNCATLLPVMVSRSRHLQHALYIDKLTADFRAIKAQLEMLVATSESSEEFEVSKSKNTIQSLEKIKLAKTAHSTLYEMAVELNNVVSLSQLVNLTQGFIYITSDLHTLYMKLYINDFDALPEIGLSLLPTFAALVLVTYSCEQCLGEVRLIGYLLHNIDNDDKQNQFDLIIENFSLQILHEPLGFSVAGFFNLDFMLLKAMVAAITTYMVIFIQFMPKEETVTNVTEAIANNTN